MSSVSEILRPSFEKKIPNALKADRVKHRITFNPNKASPGETIYIAVPKLDDEVVLVPGSLALVFNLVVSGHVNNFLVNNVSRALVSRLMVKFAGEILQDTNAFDIYKLFEDLFLPKAQRDNMYLEGIQTEELCKIRSNSGDKKTSGVDAEKKLNTVYGNKYRIPLDHEILKDHGVFYPSALHNALMFGITLAPANMVVKGSDSSKLDYELKNIELEYEVIRNVDLARETSSSYLNGKDFMYEHVTHHKTLTVNKAEDTSINVSINVPRRSMKGILLLFCEPHAGGARDSEKFFNPDITKVMVSINGVPNKVNSQGLEPRDQWEEVLRHFGAISGGITDNMDATKFYTGDKFGLFIDLRSMKDGKMHGSGLRLVNTKDGVQLEIERKGSGSGTVKCHIFILVDAQFNILNNELESAMY